MTHDGFFFPTNAINSRSVSLVAQLISQLLNSMFDGSTITDHKLFGLRFSVIFVFGFSVGLSLLLFVSNCTANSYMC